LIQTLPIFPLHTVLFPGTPIQLHIFEDRYIKMVHQCLETDGRFGVSLIKQGHEALGPLAHPFELGCSAAIREIEPLDDGRMMLVAQGLERVRIEEILSTQPFLTASVSEHPILGKEDDSLKSLSIGLFPLVHRYLEIVASEIAGELSSFQLPDEPTALAYLTGSLMQIPLDEKQSLLSLESAGELIRATKHTLRREIALQRSLQSRDPLNAYGSFGLN
jgi:Lon protease-like protein